MEYEIGEAREDQMAARECYVAKLEIDDHLYALNIEEKRLTVDLVSLDDDIPSQTTCIGIKADPSIRK